MFSRDPSWTPLRTVKPLAPLIQIYDYLDKVSAEVQVCIMSYWQPNHKNTSEMSAFLCPHLEGIQNPGSGSVSWFFVEEILSSYRLRRIDNIKYSRRLFCSGVLVLDVLK